MGIEIQMKMGETFPHHEANEAKKTKPITKSNMTCNHGQPAWVWQFLDRKLRTRVYKRACLLACLFVCLFVCWFVCLFDRSFVCLQFVVLMFLCVQLHFLVYTHFLFCDNSHFSRLNPHILVAKIRICSYYVPWFNHHVCRILLVKIHMFIIF